MEEVGNETEDIYEEAREGEADRQQEEIFDGEAEDMALKKIAPNHSMPGQAEIDEHEVDHIPYRQWCEECVRGRGTGEPHSPSEGIHAMPVVEFDYIFVTDKEIYRREELDDEAVRKAAIKILVVKRPQGKGYLRPCGPSEGRGRQWVLCGQTGGRQQVAGRHQAAPEVGQGGGHSQLAASGAAEVED